MGAGESTIAGSILPCANCHGHDGRGKPEGGVVPSDITWDALTKPYGVTHASGRTHPPYTGHLIKRAITMGIDPAGNSLETAMPRFQLSNDDMADLTAYLKRLGQNIAPGLTGTTVRLGVILPPASAPSNLNAALREALVGYFARLNGSGGVYGRRIDLNFTELPANPSTIAKALRDFIEREQIFALAGSFFTGAETEIADVLRATGTPGIGAFAAFPLAGSPPNPYVFYLDGGCKDQLEALVDFAVREYPNKKLRLAIANSNEEISRRMSQALAELLRKKGFDSIAVGNGDQQPDADIVFWLRRVAPPLSPSAFLIPGAFAASGFRPGARVFVAMPESEGCFGADMLMDTLSVRTAVRRAVASAEIIAEALKRAGRGVSREALVQELEGFYQVSTSLGVPVTFGPNRRIGAPAVTVDKR